MQYINPHGRNELWPAAKRRVSDPCAKNTAQPPWNQLAEEIWLQN